MDQTEERYQVILNNQLGKGFTLDKVLDNLSILFKKDKEKIRQIISHPDFVVKSDISIDQAKKIQSKLTKAGISSYLHKIQSANALAGSLPSGAKVSCPKCGLLQSAKTECQNCGIIFSKYGSTDNVYEPKKKVSKVETKSKRSDAWYTNGTNVFIVLIITITAILLLSTYKGGEEKKIDLSKVGIMYYEIEEVRFLDDLAEPGYTTIVELFADWCQTCTDYGNYEKNHIMRMNPRMAIRRIDISRPNGFNVAMEHFKIDIRSVPYIIVFDEDGNVIADDGEGDSSGGNYVWYYGR